MSAGTAATAITKVMPAGVDGVAVDVAAGGGDAVVGVAVDVGGVVVAGVGAGVGVSGDGIGVGSGPMFSPHSVPASDRLVASPSCAAMIAFAICPGPPSASMRHCHPARSCGLTPAFGAATSHSSSFRHAIVMERAVMLAAMALSGSPSIPAVIAFLGSMTSNTDRRQVEVSGLSGSGPGTNPAMNSCAMVSSSRHPMSRSCSSVDPGPGPVNARARLSGSSPMQASSVSESSESSVWGSCNWSGTSTPRAVKGPLVQEWENWPAFLLAQPWESPSEFPWMSSLEPSRRPSLSGCSVATPWLRQWSPGLSFHPGAGSSPARSRPSGSPW